MSNQWEWWQNALAGNIGAIHDGHPETGFYRRRAVKNGPFVPVAIWKDDLGLQWCLVNGREADADKNWTYCCRNPITREAYDAAMAGAPWPDQDARTVPDAPGSVVGHNDGSQDEATTIKDQVAAAKVGMIDYAKITSDEQQAKAQSLRSRLLELKGQAERAHEQEKAPHWKKCKEIDAKWLPTAKDAEAAANQIRAAMGAYETEKDRIAKAERARIEQERLRAEAARREAELANQPLPPLPESEPIAEPVAPTLIKGAYGRAASVKVVKIAQVDDQDKAYQAMRTHPELVSLIGRLAQRAIDAGHEIAGVSFTEERKVA